MKYITSILLGLLALISTPTLANSTVGMQLYDKHCASCHGAIGDGGVGVPLALPDFQAGVSDHYLTQTIKHGRVGRIMPAFPSFSDQELASIVRYVRSFANVTPPSFDSTRIKGNSKHGATLFKNNCAACHGAQGEGGKGTGVTMSRPRSAPIIAPALNNPGFLASASDTLIKTALMKGRANTPMSSFLKQGLTEQDINDIVAYVRSFADKQHAKLNTQADEANIIYESPYSLEKTVDNIRKAAVGKNFRLIRQQYIQDGFVAKGKENKRQVIVYFCNFKLLNESLAIDPRVGMFLPCRATVIEHKGKVLVMAINPLRLSQLFNNDELDLACKSMRSLYEEILEEATL